MRLLVDITFHSEEEDAEEQVLSLVRYLLKEQDELQMRLSEGGVAVRNITVKAVVPWELVT